MLLLRLLLAFLTLALCAVVYPPLFPFLSFSPLIRLAVFNAPWRRRGAAQGLVVSIACKSAVLWGLSGARGRSVAGSFNCRRCLMGCWISCLIWGDVFFLIYRYLFYFPFFSLSFFIIEISVQLRPSAAALPFEAIWFLRFIFFPLSNWKETPPPKKTNFHLFSLVFLLRMFRWRRTLMDAAITNTNSNKKMQHTHESSSSIFLSFNPERCGVEISTIELSAILTPPPSCLIH